MLDSCVMQRHTGPAPDLFSKYFCVWLKLDFKSVIAFTKAYCTIPPNCAQLTPDYIFDCKAILASLVKLDASPQDIFYSPQAPDLASLLIGTFGPI
ncbi:hypothetical protein TNCV_4004131 [Trichonephila clavipes]|nr:hypothetical protein TNCV_4004131 [Trichonephila clavipes]